MAKKRKANHVNDDLVNQPPKKIHIPRVPQTAPLTSKLAELNLLLSTAIQNPDAAIGNLAAIETAAKEARSLINQTSPIARKQALKDVERQMPSNNSLYLHNVQIPAPPTIKDARLEQIVFRHKGCLRAHENVSDSSSYERYEFFGDAYIEVMATRLIWALCPNLPTGRLSPLREQLVNNKTLGEFSTAYGFDKRLLATDQVSRDEKGLAKIKADVFEAYVAAVILDDPVHGFEKAEEWLHQLWLPKLGNLDVSAGPNLGAKEDLARKIGGANVKLNYIDERPAVLHRDKGIETYFVGVYLDGWGYENLHLGSGRGLNKKAAGNEAATVALKNHPLIDEIAAKKTVHDVSVKKQRVQVREEPG